MSPRKKNRVPLSRERVVDAARRLADEEGVEALSMRKIAAKLRVEAMSLYNHVANKDEILDALVEDIIAKIEVPTLGDWRSEMQSRAYSARKVLLAHPWAAILVESRSNLGPNRLTHNDAVLGALMRGGFSVDQASLSFLALDSYIYGFILQELNWPTLRERDPELQAWAGEVEGPVFPNLTKVVEHFIEHGSPADDANFQFGLDLILDGLERLLDR